MKIPFLPRNLALRLCYLSSVLASQVNFSKYKDVVNLALAIIIIRMIINDKYKSTKAEHWTCHMPR